MPAKQESITDYRHGAKRKNIPPAALAAQGRVSEIPRPRYYYDPHLPPALRFDGSGESDRLPELLEEATSRRLTEEEVRTLSNALRNREPWLEWAGKREKKYFEIDPVALHIHERVSAQAAIRIAARQDVQRDFWADPEQEYHEAVQFYQHDVDWANRLILGDSLLVMSSLAKREDLAGKVQMIYIDPPYGISYRSNFQPFVRNRDVKEKEEDLTREPEVVKAYRDTWTLGVHTYLEYLRDRLIVARELLADSGSIFVQIGDENVHRVREVMDEVFGDEHFGGMINFQKTGSLAGSLLPGTVDYIIWFTKNRLTAKYRQLFKPRREGTTSLDRYDYVQTPRGGLTKIPTKAIRGEEPIPNGDRCRLTTLLSDGVPSEVKPFSFQGVNYPLRHGKHWKTDPAIGGIRLSRSDRVVQQGSTVWYKRFVNDFPVLPLDDRMGERPDRPRTDLRSTDRS